MAGIAVAQFFIVLMVREAVEAARSRSANAPPAFS
jgi:hypothetical protein